VGSKSLRPLCTFINNVYSVSCASKEAGRDQEGEDICPTCRQKSRKIRYIIPLVLARQTDKTLLDLWDEEQEQVCKGPEICSDSTATGSPSREEQRSCAFVRVTTILRLILLQLLKEKEKEEKEAAKARDLARKKMEAELLGTVQVQKVPFGTGE
jgi:hypothetical protein